MKIAFLTAAFAFTVNKSTVPSIKTEEKKVAVCRKGPKGFSKVNVEKDTLPMILGLDDLAIPGQRLPDESKLFLDEDCHVCEHTRFESKPQRRPFGEDYVFPFQDLPDALTTIDPLEVMVHTRIKGDSSGYVHVCIMDDKEDATYCVGEVPGVGRKKCDLKQCCEREHVFRMDPHVFNKYKQNGEIVIKVDAPHTDGVPTCDPSACFAEVYLKYVAIEDVNVLP